jgi:hypothetical protein
MAEMKTLSGYEIVDAKARQDIAEHDTRITEVEKFFAAADSNGVIDKLVEVQKYIEDDAEAAASLIQSISDVDAKVDAIHIPTKVSELDNDSGYLTEHQSLDNYFTKAQTTSAINEAVEGIEIPEVDLTPYAKAADIPTKVSQLDNDANYLTEHQSLEGLATEQYVDSTKLAILDIYNCLKISDTSWKLTDNVKSIIQRLFNGERFPLVIAPYSHIQYIPSSVSVTSDEIKIERDTMHGYSSGTLTALITDTYVFTNTNGRIELQIRTSNLDVTDSYEYSKQLAALEARVAALEGK